MPIYEYRCDQCGHEFEVRQSVGDDPVQDCPRDDCDGEVQKVLSPPTIVFKGSGFHVNDYDHHGRRSSAKESSATPEAAGDDTEASDASEDSETKEAVGAEAAE